MKLSVRKKIANGLVICLLVPRAGESAIELYETYSEGLESFAAADDFDLAAGKGSTAEVTVNQVEGADPTGGDPTGGDPTGGDPTGGDPTGGDPTGGDPTGGDPTGGDPTGGDPTGGDPTGGDPTGGDPTGGDPTGGDPTGGDPTGGDPTGGDPTGGDPTGGEPCPPASTPPTLNVDGPRQLLTAEDGTAALFEVSMAPDPAVSRHFSFVSTRPDEAQPVPNAVTFGDDACIPQSIWVVGQNDTLVDGDQPFDILIVDEQDFEVDSVPGVNLDNDNYPGIAVAIEGPPAIPAGESAVFLVEAINGGREPVSKNTFYIEATSGLEITDFAASTVSGNSFKSKAKLKKGMLIFKDVELAVGDALVVSVDVKLVEATPEQQKITARFMNSSTGQENDTDQNVGTRIP